MKYDYYHASDGEWVRVAKNGFRERCCDCGLIHDVDFKIIEGKYVEFKARVNHRATAAARRALKKRYGR